MRVEDQQEINLHQNWEVRKDLAKKIAAENHCDIYDYADGFGRRVFYILLQGTPIGYVQCYECSSLGEKVLQINSTYITPVHRRTGRGVFAYTTIALLGDHLLTSDTEKSEGATALWRRLADNPSLNVYDNGFGRTIARKK